MRGYTRIAAAAVTLALAVSTAACGSSGGGDNKKPSDTNGSSTSAAPLADFKTLTGESTTVTFDSTFLSELTKLRVFPAAVAPATLSGNSGTFPIKSGHATVNAKGTNPAVTGEVTHSGGIQLTANGTKVALRDFVLTLGKESTLKGQVVLNGSPFGSSPITFFDVDTSTMTTPVTGSGTATLSGATVYVAADAATALNAAFDLTGTANALPTGEHALKVGVATIKLAGK